MKKLLVLFVLLLSVSKSSFAAETLSLGEFRDRSNGFKEYEVDFQVNKELGRVWVEFGQTEDDGEDEWYSTIARIKVKGLRYDRQSEEIIYSTASEDVVCSRKVTKKVLFFKTNYMKKTGRCKLSYEKFKKSYDDGYEIQKVKKVKVILEILDLN